MASKRVLLLDDNRSLAAIDAQTLHTRHRVIVDLPLDSFHAIEMMKQNVYDVIFIDRGLTYSISRSIRRGDNHLDPLGEFGSTAPSNTTKSEDGFCLAQAIRGMGPDAKRCSDILEANRKAYLILSSGIQGFTAETIPGIDLLYGKRSSLPDDTIVKVIEIGLGLLEQGARRFVKEMTKKNSPLEQYLYEALAFDRESPLAGWYKEAPNIDLFFMEIHRGVRNRDKPDSPYRNFLEAAERNFQANKRPDRNRLPKAVKRSPG